MRSNLKQAIISNPIAGLWNRTRKTCSVLCAINLRRQTPVRRKTRHSAQANIFFDQARKLSLSRRKRQFCPLTLIVTGASSRYGACSRTPARGAPLPRPLPQRSQRPQRAGDVAGTGESGGERRGPSGWRLGRRWPSFWAGAAGVSVPGAVPPMARLVARKQGCLAGNHQRKQLFG